MLISSNDAARLAGISYGQLRYLKDEGFLLPAESTPGRDYYTVEQILLVYALNLLKRRTWEELLPARDLIVDRLASGEMQDGDRIAIVASFPMIINEDMKAGSLFDDHDVMALQIRATPQWKELKRRIYNHPIVLKNKRLEAIGA